MISPPLPPPPAPPQIPSQKEQRHPNPTFIEQWLVDNEKRKKNQKAASSSNISAEKKNINNKREYFERQCLFPRHIPQSAMCNIEPMLYLIHDFHADANYNKITKTSNVGTSPITNAAVTTAAWGDIRQIASHCATYKSRAEQNHIEFQHKRAVKIRQQQQHQRQSSTLSAISIEKNNLDPPSSDISTSTSTSSLHSNTSIADSDNSAPTTTSTIPTNQRHYLHPAPQPPPFHPEYTPLTLPENFLLSKIHSANYNVCLAHASCPQLSSQLLACWKRSDPTWVQHMQQHGLEQYICTEERMAVERCVGRRVQNAMKDILG
jgi:hypothetical protein